MESARTSKQIIKEWVEENMSTHTDWTGTRVETKHTCESIEEFVNKLLNCFNEKDYNKRYEYAKELYDYYMNENNDFDILYF